MEKNTLYKYFSGLASDSEKEVIRLWMEESPEHARMLNEERRFYDAIQLADETEFMETRRPIAYRIRRWAGETIKWAAAVVIAFIASYAYFNFNSGRTEIAMNTVTVPYGQRVNMSLSDGTQVCLNAGTVFTYPSTFGKDMRKVELDGEAYFEVSHNEEKPFVVHTQACDVQVLGTKFNVDAYKSEARFSTALMEGKVKVQNNANPSNVVYLNPHNQVTLVNGNLKVSGIPDYDVYRWKEGLICFDGLDFAQLMQRAEKYYGIEIVINNSALHHRNFTGKFRISDGIDYLLRVLQRDIDFSFTRSDEENRIYIN